MSDDRIKAFWLGIFIIVAIAITAWLLLFLKPSVGDGEKTLRVRFSNIEKVSVGTWVTYAGKPVGKVVEINEIFDARDNPASEDGDIYFYELVLEVDSKVKIFSSDEIVFSSSGLIGEKTIAIIPRAPRKGAPTPHEVTNDILYARSTDKIEEALSQISQVSGTIKEAMRGIDGFICENSRDFNRALNSLNTATNNVNVLLDHMKEVEVIAKTAQAAASLNRAMTKTDIFFGEALDRDILGRLSQSIDHIHNVSTLISEGEGTLGRLINSDSLYLQISAFLCKFETILSDIQSHGLLFQYDRSWRRKRLYQVNRLRNLCSPKDFSRTFNEDLCSIHMKLDEVSQILDIAECKEVPIENECFAQSFRELLDRVSDLEKTLKSYNEMLFNQSCQQCSE